MVERCRAAGIGVFGVTKGTCGMPQVARAMLRGGVTGIGESRFENIRRLRASGIDAPIMLLRSPPLSLIEEVIKTVDISLNSELAIIRELSRVAERMARVHEIILMVDLGDLREGIWPSDLVPTVEQVMQLPGVRIAGVGTNLTCFGAIIPTEINLGAAGRSRRYAAQDIRPRPHLRLRRQFQLACPCCWRDACRRASTTCASARRSCRAGATPSMTSPGRTSIATSSCCPANCWR